MIKFEALAMKTDIDELHTVMGHLDTNNFILFYFILFSLEEQWRRHVIRKSHDRSHDVTS